MRYQCEIRRVSGLRFLIAVKRAPVGAPFIRCSWLKGWCAHVDYIVKKIKGAF